MGRDLLGVGPGPKSTRERFAPHVRSCALPPPGPAKLGCPGLRQVPPHARTSAPSAWPPPSALTSSRARHVVFAVSLRRSDDLRSPRRSGVCTARAKPSERSEAPTRTRSPANGSRTPSTRSRSMMAPSSMAQAIRPGSNLPHHPPLDAASSRMQTPPRLQV